jgi:hypothetical protein
VQTQEHYQQYLRLFFYIHAFYDLSFQQDENLSDIKIRLDISKNHNFFKSSFFEKLPKAPYQWYFQHSHNLIY